VRVKAGKSKDRWFVDPIHPIGVGASLGPASGDGATLGEAHRYPQCRDIAAVGSTSAGLSVSAVPLRSAATTAVPSAAEGLHQAVDCPCEWIRQG